MTASEIIKWYGTARKAAEAIGVTEQAISYWKSHGDRVPFGRQCQVQIMTGGRLVAEDFKRDSTLSR